MAHAAALLLALASLFANERVAVQDGATAAVARQHDAVVATVWRYTWREGRRTPMHFHARDAVVVFTADGVLASITPDGKTVLNPHSFGLTKFSPRGRVHQEELQQGKASAVIVELK